jgi:hypothetical protein
MESFVRPGPGLENWVSRTNYPALGIVPTGDNEMSLYVQRNYGQPTARLDRFALRPDGFASIHAPYFGSELTTKVLQFKTPAGAGSREAAAISLTLNVATSAAGTVRVEIQDAEGKPVPGFALDDCTEIIGDELDRPVAWEGGSLDALAGKPFRLRFEMKDADLYSIKFPGSIAE